MQGLQQIRPAHQIHLSENSQFYAVVLGPATMMLAENTAILSFYKVQYKSQSETQREDYKTETLSNPQSETTDVSVPHSTVRKS